VTHRTRTPAICELFGVEDPIAETAWGGRRRPAHGRHEQRRSARHLALATMTYTELRAAIAVGQVENREAFGVNRVPTSPTSPSASIC
jgi:hypothetical protein